MDFVFNNELILENIFTYLSTPDLLLRVNRTSSKWNQIAKKLVQLKQKIFIDTDNVMRYVDMISLGGTSHKFINLRLNKDFNQKFTLVETDAPKIIATFSKFGKNVRDLDLKEGFLLETELSLCYSPETEDNLFCRLLQDCPNVENISILTPGIDDISKDLDLPEFKPLKSLVSLKIDNWGSVSSILCSFLRVAPNIREISLKGYKLIDIEDFLKIEKQFPSFSQKVVECRICPDRKNVDFLTSRNFNSLRKLKFKLMNREEIFYNQILTHYAHQLVYLKIDMGYWLKEDLQVLDLTLPVMKNLEILKLDQRKLCFGTIKDRKFGVCRFWECEENKRVFPKLANFRVVFNGHYFKNEFQYEDAKEILESFCKASFPNNVCHPIFPSVKVFHFADSILEDFIDNMSADRKTLILKLIKNYFPNLSLFSENCEND